MTAVYLVIGFCGFMCTERDAPGAPFYSEADCVRQAVEWRVVAMGGYYRCVERRLER